MRAKRCSICLSFLALALAVWDWVTKRKIYLERSCEHLSAPVGAGTVTPEALPLRPAGALSASYSENKSKSCAGFLKAGRMRAGRATEPQPQDADRPRHRIGCTCCRR